MTDGTVLAALFGAAGGIVSSVGVSLLARKKTAAEAELATAEAVKARAEAARATAETARMSLETEELRKHQQQISSRVANNEASLAYERSGARLLSVYDSDREPFNPLDFQLLQNDGAQARLDIAVDDDGDTALVLFRANSAGRVYLWLLRYDYLGSPEVIPVGAAAGIRRRLRVQCEVRALSAGHTFLLVLKSVDSPPGEHLDERRERIEGEQWVSIDAVFSVATARDFRLRIEDRNVSAAPSRLEIRRLVITERDAPSALRPADSRARNGDQSGG